MSFGSTSNGEVKRLVLVLVIGEAFVFWTFLGDRCGRTERDARRLLAGGEVGGEVIVAASWRVRGS